MKIKIRFDGYQKEWEVPEGFKPVGGNDLNIGDKVYLIGIGSKRYKGEPAAYGPHEVATLPDRYGELKLKSGSNHKLVKNRKFDIHVSELLVKIETGE